MTSQSWFSFSTMIKPTGTAAIASIHCTILPDLPFLLVLRQICANFLALSWKPRDANCRIRQRAITVLSLKSQYLTETIKRKDIVAHMSRRLQFIIMGKRGGTAQVMVAGVWADAVHVTEDQEADPEAQASS